MPYRPRGSADGIGYRDRSLLPRLGATMPSGSVLFDTNVFINAVAGRELIPPRALVDGLADAYVAAPTRAELSWLIGRLDPDHPGTARVVAAIKGALSRIDPAKVLVPTDADW